MRNPNPVNGRARQQVIQVVGGVASYHVWLLGIDRGVREFPLGEQAQLPGVSSTL